jgi:hypothetical protein
MAIVKHWLEGRGKPSRYTCLIPRDMRDTACGLTIISESEDPERYSTVPSQVTCKRCLCAYNFGQRI